MDLMVLKVYALNVLKHVLNVHHKLSVQPVNPDIWHLLIIIHVVLLVLMANIMLMVNVINV